MFIDKARIFVIAGSGGDGMKSFRREKYVPLGGPDGGNGGSGGDVYLIADPQTKTLLDFKYKPKYMAESGQKGGTANKYGKCGADLLIKLPPGTIVAKNGEFFHDFTVGGEKILIAKGGRGGRGNRAFKTQRNVAPDIYEKGQPGETATLDLELKLIADIGIIGLPNAGKSTLLSVISSAHPKIAPYPFTTLSPNLGVAKIGEKSFVFADIPGLIEGSHLGRGLGQGFLRHIERTKILIHVVDGSGFEKKEPYENYKTILRELSMYSKTLSQKPMVIAFNKTDIPESLEQLKTFRKKIKKHKIFPVSAATGKGIKELIECAAEMADKLPASPPEYENVVKFKYSAPYEIFSDGAVFEIRGAKIEELAAMTDFENQESLRRFQDIIKKMGVEKALQKKGIQDGDTVKINDLEFTYSR